LTTTLSSGNQILNYLTILSQEKYNKNYCGLHWKVACAKKAQFTQMKVARPSKSKNRLSLLWVWIFPEKLSRSRAQNKRNWKWESHNRKISGKIKLSILIRKSPKGISLITHFARKIVFKGQRKVLYLNYRRSSRIRFKNDRKTLY
jgi:hypothetical protein